VPDKTTFELEKLTKAYSQVLSAPLLPLPRITFLKEQFKDLPYEITENNYSLTVKVPGESTQKLVYMSHLDHPGIVVKNRHEGICLGSLFPDRLLRTISKDGHIPLDIYSPTGKQITKGKLVGLAGKFHQKAILDIPVYVPPNSVANYQIGFFGQDKDFYHLYAADNDVPTICMINLLQNIKAKPHLTLLFVFTFYEEVHQISSFELARKNLLNLSEKDYVLNLECKKIENHSSNPAKNTLDYDSGPVLQSGEKDCLYGYQFSSPNHLERLVASVCKKEKIKIQYGLGLGSTDARPFSNFKLTPHICTLDVPNSFKHNCDDSGEVVLEKIYKKDILAMYEIIRSLAFVDHASISQAVSSQEIFLSDRFKKKDTFTNRFAMTGKTLLNYRLDFANKVRITTKQYYPTNFFFSVLDSVMNLLSYPYYYFLKVTQTLQPK
jgi:putative aminopeptidase FrvX